MPHSVDREPSLLVSELYYKGAPRRDVIVKRDASTEAGAFTFSLLAGEDAVSNTVCFRPCFEDEWERFERVASVEWTGCEFGSRRAWIVCSRCAGRAARAFISCAALAGELLCHRCAGFRYPSQNRAPWERLSTRIDKIRSELGGLPTRGQPDVPLPQRPRGMHQTTYFRRIQELKLLEAELEDLLETTQLGRLLRVDEHDR